jgi:very-short-patch-repair endonuclease
MLEEKRIFNTVYLKSRRKELRARQTREEALLWEHLRNKRLSGYKFYRQFSVGPYILDFYCPKALLCVEIDGDYHLKVDEMQYDQERKKYLKTLKIREVRFSNDEVNSHIDFVLEKIMSAIGTLQIPS